MRQGTPAVECRSSFGFHWLGACRHYWQGAKRQVAFLLFLGTGLVIVQPCVGGSGVFENTGSLVIAREAHTATLLPNGKVFVEANASLNRESAELYDPAS